MILYVQDLKELVEKLERNFKRWEHLKVFGGSDPFWEDGFNMNLVRGHIIVQKEKIKELCEKEGLELPEIFHIEVPPKVDNKYMARADEIREKAKKALLIYENDENFRELEQVFNSINEKNKKEIANNILRYKRGLKHYIDTDDLVGMRLYLNCINYLESAEAFMKNLSPGDFAGQLSLF